METRAPRPTRSRLPLPAGLLSGFGLAIVAVVVMAAVSFRTLRSRSEAADQVTHTLQTIKRLDHYFATLKDAELNQRRYLITADEQFIGRWETSRGALAGELAAVRAMMGDNAEQLHRLDALEPVVKERLARLVKGLELRREGRIEEAFAEAQETGGRASMAQIRTLIEELQKVEQRTLETQQARWESAASLSAVVSWAGSAILLVLVFAAAFMTSRDYQAREAEAWIRAGLMGLSAKMQGDQRLDSLGENVLSYVAHLLEAQVGALYLVDPGGALRRFGGYALPAGGEHDEVRHGDGLLGQAARDKKVLWVRDVPDGYLPIHSAVGAGRPRELAVVPALTDGKLQAVLELGFFRALADADRALLERAAESIAIAVRSAKDRTRLEELLEETQRQSEELQTQQEELKVANEELTEQGQVLKDSQARLEAQQAELEQTNAQLEEQTQLLENQKENLVSAQRDLEEKAAELSRANQYKSEFLANMSHELRTPLNSSLILAKLLADNKQGNLTEEQVKFAQTISEAGNDLLALINDILDLSKIESGKVEVQPENLQLTAMVEGLVRGLQPMAQQKGLRLALELSPELPPTLHTDEQRLRQILKNLLSNALKFTERGSVTLAVSPQGQDQVRFAVTDTGIGIPAHQQQVIFEAFRQADGSTHRKYGGTGLGLSISRDLAQLLGGDITLHSVPGEGSTFTMVLPVTWTGSRNARVVPAARPHAAPPSPVPAPQPAPLATARSGTPPRPAERPIPAAEVEDDRDRLGPDARTLLVIEDDVRFATILRDLGREQGFQCVITHSASAGLAAAHTLGPKAILLDVNLPDLSGLGVLDQLKRDPRTRHVPVHVVSVANYAQEALELGAVGYALKPVQREELVQALRLLEAKFSQQLRRVLVVEDDERQRESIGQLLRSDQVEIVGVETAAAALEQLASTTFDCMVMDLNLPDLSGYELLDRMAEQESVSFPPVIIYTGRSLSQDEEHRLRRHSRSIIIKDARSPERLLDEVTLFLHQVEAHLPADRQRMLKEARNREEALEGRRILVVEDDVRNVFALSSVLEPRGARVEIARNGREALEALTRGVADAARAVDLVLMDIMMPEMDGLTAMREIRRRPEWQKLPIIALTAKAMRDDQERCLAAGANDYIAKPLDVEKLLSLVRVWMAR